MALDKHKTDPDLGIAVSKILVTLGVETPMKKDSPPTDMEEQLDNITTSMGFILKDLGLDLEDDSLRDTPKRIAKMFVNEIFWGLNYDNFPKITVIDNKMGYTSMLLGRNIRVNSTCEHHFLPIMGTAFIAYLPKDKVIGLSKINRVVEFFCRRPQVQERLSEQIFHTLCYILGTNSVAVIIKADHTCVKLRGVEDVNSDTITSKLGGAFMESDSLRNEFYNSIKL